jgi:Flp pilus assembly protein TadD
MYQMLTGEVPFKSDTALNLLIAQIQVMPNPIRRVRPDVEIPEALAQLVMRMLQKKRELRPASAAALIEELTRVEMGMPVMVSRLAPKAGGAIPAPPRGPISAPPSRAPQIAKPVASTHLLPDARSSSIPWPVLILIIILLIVAGVWYHAMHRPAVEIARHQAAASDFERQRLFPQAEQEYRAAVQIDPNDAALQSALGHVLVEERKWDEAISVLRAAIALQPDDAVAHNNLGVALQTVGNVADAIPEFRQAIRVQPDYLEAHSNLGTALGKQNDLTGSITEFSEVLRLKPDDPEAHFHRGQAYYKQGNADGAVEEYREALRLQPGLALAHFGLGAVLYNRGDHDAGLEELRTAYSLSPDDPEIRAAYQKLLEK